MGSQKKISKLFVFTLVILILITIITSLFVIFGMRVKADEATVEMSAGIETRRQYFNTEDEGLITLEISSDFEQINSERQSRASFSSNLGKLSLGAHKTNYTITNMFSSLTYTYHYTTVKDGGKFGIKRRHVGGLMDGKSTYVDMTKLTNLPTVYLSFPSSLTDKQTGKFVKNGNENIDFTVVGKAHGVVKGSPICFSHKVYGLVWSNSKTGECHMFVKVD